MSGKSTPGRKSGVDYMNSRPPKEGARWGDDPAPEPKPAPAPETGPPPEYLALCDEFGEPNVQKALQIRQRMKTEVPHASFIKSSELHFARVILENAKRSLQIAAKDGRPHTFPETLDILEGELSAFLLQNPNWEPSDNFTLSYGDEATGKAAQLANIKENLWLIGFAVAAFVGIWIYRDFSTAVGGALGFSVAAGLLALALKLLGVK
ncbi:MAG: hypothetical protein ABJN26_14055 [Stappiaceae bacterium]